ncbi:distal tail protein Dit [Neobacillus sp. 3P2-tot-E-2]|uniref:distal tail protein Dit n=1 Tax=Neobacillus sp. 3P2-tot-E-2 TaxID=3132212 RepID=UPI0039A1F2DC
MITFNGVDLSNLIKVKSIGGRGPLSQSVVRTTVPGKDGAYAQRKKIPERPIPVTFDITGASLTDIHQKVDSLNAILNTESDVPILFSDEAGKTYYGQLDGQPNWEEMRYKGRGSFNILCCDPCKYGAETSTTFVNTGSPNVSGNNKTFPKLEVTFTASATEYKITHVATGKYVRVIDTFVAGEVLGIDFATGKITLNGTVAMSILDWSNSEFFPLKPGANSLSVTPTSIANTKVLWKPRWM